MKRTRHLKVGLALICFVFVVGLVGDLFGSIELWIAKRSVGAWLLGTLALGVLYLAGEVIGDWIHRRDKTTDPLGRRVLNLLLLLAFAGIGLVIAWTVWAAVT
jgi:hypothetical protein